MTGSDSSSRVGEPESTERERTAERLRLQDGTRVLLQAFSRTASSALNLPAGLAVLCHEATPLLRASCTSAWLHDRRCHELILAASSGATAAIEGARVRADSPRLPAIALRDEGARYVAAADGSPAGTVAVPLKGQRRALGVLLVEGVDRTRANDGVLVAGIDEMGRQLSAAIENLLLLEDVLQSRRQLTGAFDSLEDMVAVCDARLRVAHVNRALAERLALPRDRMIDRPLAELLGPGAGRWIASLDTSDETRTPAVVSREVDDEVLAGRLAMTVTPLPGREGRTDGAVFVARDVTGQTRLRQEREALRQRLAQAEKLAAVGQFVAGVAHELNNPLQGVLGHLELLRRQGRVPAGIRREVDRVSREADRAARIVENLLLFAGGRTFTRRSLSLNTLARGTLAMRARACRAARIEVERVLDERQPRVSGNRVMLQQALLNLLVNAEQELAPRGGGRIEVRTGMSGQGARARIEVRDTGAGIATDALPRVFEPFYTTKDVGRGTGLGLAVAYGIIKDHGGTLSAGNHPEGGAVFTIELPLAPGRA